MPFKRWNFGLWSCFGKAEIEEAVISPGLKREKTFSKILLKQQTLFHSLVFQYGKASEGLISVEDYTKYKSDILRESIMEEEGGDWPAATRSKLVFIQELLYMGTITEANYHKAKHGLLQRLANMDADLAVDDFIVDPLDMTKSMDDLSFSPHFRRLEEISARENPSRPPPRRLPYIFLISRIFSLKTKSSKRHAQENSTTSLSSYLSSPERRARGPPSQLPHTQDFPTYGKAPNCDQISGPSRFLPPRELFPENSIPVSAPSPQFGTRVAKGAKKKGKAVVPKTQSRGISRNEEIFYTAQRNPAVQTESSGAINRYPASSDSSPSESENRRPSMNKTELYSARPVDVKERSKKRDSFLRKVQKCNLRRAELKAQRIAEGLSVSLESPEFRMHLDYSDSSGGKGC